MRFVSENYGESELARRFGVTRYPALFVDDVLVAKPKDFGFYGQGEGKGDGRYTPLKDPRSHARFQADLARMLDLVLAGRRDAARAAAPAADEPALASLPAFELRDLDGRTIAPADLAGRVVLVEFWATWCPPCRGALGWLAGLRQRLGGDVVVLALAVDSEEPAVRRWASELGPSVRVAMATPEVARAFGDILAVPTLFVFGRDGRAAGTFYGAPPGLHEKAEALVAGLDGVKAPTSEAAPQP